VRKPISIVLVVLLVALIGLVAWLVLPERQPVHRGMPVFAWIRDGYFRSATGVTPQQANEAVLAVGTNGVPYYMSLLETGPDLPLKHRMLEWTYRHVYPRLDLTSADVRLRRAIGACALSILGAQAKEAIPALTNLVTNGEADQKGMAAEALADIGLHGVPFLTNQLINPKSESRTLCFQVLGRYSEPRYLCGQAKPRAPEEVDAAGRILVPMFVAHLNDADTEMQANSITLAGMFAGQPKVVVPILAEHLGNATNTMELRSAALQALGGYGVEAKAAVPMLQQSLQDQDPVIRREAARILKKIDPEAAAKAGVR
jgi:hypothetical protein